MKKITKNVTHNADLLKKMSDEWYIQANKDFNGLRQR